MEDVIDGGRALHKALFVRYWPPFDESAEQTLATGI